MKKRFIAPLLLSTSIFTSAPAHSAAEQELPSPADQSEQITEIAEHDTQAHETMGQQKGYALIQFHVFGLERSLRDLAAQLKLEIDYQVIEDGWIQDSVEYTVTGPTQKVEKFFNIIQRYRDQFQLRRDPLVPVTE